MIAILCWSLCYWIWGAVVVSQNSEANGECYNVWTFALVSVILTAVFGTVSLTVSKRNEFDSQSQEEEGNPVRLSRQDSSWHDTSSRVLRMSSSVALVVTLIWGFVIYANIPESCSTMYETTYPSLWIFFQAAIWSSLAVVCFLIMYRIRHYEQL